MNKNNTLIIGIIICLVLCGGSFYGGMIYGEHKTSSNIPTRNGFGANSGQPRAFPSGGMQRGNGFPGGSGGGFINGTVTTTSDGTMTVKTADGSSKIVFTNDKTEVSSSVKAQIGDIKTDASVMVRGTTNSDGSITAQSIQLSVPQTTQ
ncbi:hypothetical protein HGA91_05815 [candidate division WWE3 bacterium]|nr:hypothetical protein [candidate division WWE3 bacterium]